MFAFSLSFRNWKQTHEFALAYMGPHIMATPVTVPRTEVMIALERIMADEATSKFVEELTL